MNKNENISQVMESTDVYRPVFDKRFLKPNFWLLWVGFLFLWLLIWVPWPVRSALSWPFGFIAYWTSRKRRHIAQINLKMCFPELAEKKIKTIVRKHFYFKIRLVLDFGILCWGSEKRLRRLIRMEGEENITTHLTRGVPVIWLTCHALALEYGAMRISLDHSGVGMVKAAKNPLADWVLQSMRTRFNAILYSRHSGLRPITKVVRKGIMFYYLPDEDLGGPESVFAPFFAIRSSTLSTLGRLSKLCKAKVTPSIAYYEPGTGKYVMRFFPALEDFPMADKEQDAVRMNQELEKLIKIQLPQYMWGMKMFKNQPDGRGDPYS